MSGSSALTQQGEAWFVGFKFSMIFFVKSIPRPNQQTWSLDLFRRWSKWCYGQKSRFLKGGRIQECWFLFRKHWPGQRFLGRAWFVIFIKGIKIGWSYLRSNSIHFLSGNQFFCKHFCSLRPTKRQKILLPKGRTLDLAEIYNGSPHEPPWTTALDIVAVQIK